MTSPWTEVPATPRRLRHRREPGLLRQSLALMLLRRPPGRARPLAIGWLLLVGAGFLFGTALIDDVMVPPPRWPNPWAVTEQSFPLLLALLLATLVCVPLRRPMLIGRVAATGLIAAAPFIWIWPWFAQTLPEDSALHSLPWFYAVLISLQGVLWLRAGASWRRQALAFAATSLALLLSFEFAPTSSWWWNEDAEDDSVVDGGDGEADFATTSPLSISPEQLWNQQAERIDAAVNALAAQRPGVVDLYAIGVAGDGSENVFRNEIAYFEQLAAQRLGAEERVLSLVNHPESIEHRPLASLTNLRRALEAVGSVMDPQEDILLLFLTSHGSRDHQFYLGLDPLPLDPLQPEALREALDAAGIRWRVLVVSACFSGGFVDALRTPETLIITAARADRPSFGCGVQSEITWFGQAFLTEALNETTDFFAAFRQAKRRIREREVEQGHDPSYPQIARGDAIGGKLEQWRRSFEPGPELPFNPEVER